jgi:hypothetical protein
MALRARRPRRADLPKAKKETEPQKFNESLKSVMPMS